MWLLLLGSGFTLGPGFIRRCKDAFDPPPNSPALLAKQKMEEYFPDMKSSTALAIFIYSKVNETVLGPELKLFTHKVNTSIYNWPCNECIGSVSGYYIFEAKGLPLVASKPFLSSSNTSTIISVNLKFRGFELDAIEFAEYLRAQMEGFIPDNCTWTAELTGISAFLRVVHESIEADFALMDGIVLPLALGLLAVLLRSLRLLILPLLCIATSALVTFTIMYGITFVFEIVSFAPSLMMSLLIAMSIDYSLFFLSRYREELLNGRTNRQAVEISVATAGHTIFVSGTTLAACFLGLVILPLTLMRSLGIGCSFILVMIMLVNLTLMPACLLLFPRFFTGCVKPFGFYFFTCTWGAKKHNAEGFPVSEDAEENSCYDTSPSGCCAVRDEEDHSYPSSHYESLQPLRNSSSQTPFSHRIDYDSEGNEIPYSSINYHQNTRWSEEEEEFSKIRHSDEDDLEEDGKWTKEDSVEEGKKVVVDAPYWYKFGALMVRFPANVLVILLVAIVVVPFGMHAFHSPTSASLGMTMPHGTSVYNTYERMVEEFGYGRLYPFQLFMVPPNGTSVLSSHFHLQSQKIIRTLATTLRNTTQDDFVGFSASPLNVPWRYASHCLKNKGPACYGINYAREMFINKEATATFFIISLQISPLDPIGLLWYDDAMALLANLTNSTGIGLYLEGMPANNADVTTAVATSFWWMIIMTCCVVLVFVAVSFRSVLLPFRSIATIGLTLLFVFGFADMVYVHGHLDFLNFQGLHGWGSIYWAPPIVSFSIIVGIGLDYDIFLLVRIKEYRDMGYSTSEAIVLGFAKTGHIITAAGVIMSVAFSGLLFSAIPGMNMLSFYMVFAVIFDTFVVRSLLVPSMMSLFQDANWWPGPLPKMKLVHDPKLVPVRCCSDPEQEGNGSEDGEGGERLLRL